MRDTDQLVETAADVEPFSAVLRERTKLVHREAERTGFIAALIRGRATRQGYALYLRNLAPAYDAMEAALRDAEPRGPLRPFADPHLHRLEHLTSDLVALAGPHWSTLLLLPESATYANAIRAAAGDPPRLAAHAYARYLGDLSGGQILRPLLGRTLGLGPDMLRFYDFPAYPDPEAPKAAMRRAFDAIDPASHDARTMVEEAIGAFRHNIALSTAVDAAQS